MEQITNTPLRIRRSEQEILKLLTEFEITAVNINEFCLTHNIGKGTFHKWQSRYKSKTKKPMEAAGFAHLQITSSPIKAQAILFAEVNGIKIYRPVDASYLKELLQ
jgi:hypothetical protein